MDLLGFLNSPAGKTVIQSVSSQMGMTPKEATSAVNVAVPAILAGLTKNAQSAKGAESLNSALESKHDGSLLDNLASMLMTQRGALQEDGSGILNHVFGNNTNAIEKGVAQKTGLSMEKIGPLLTMLAPIVMAYVGKQKRQSNTAAGGLGDLLGGLLGAGAPASQKKSQAGGLLGMVSGMLDKNKDGNILDDLLGGLLK